MSKKILVVDDEKPLANALQLKLAGAGFEVDTAYDGTEAVEKITKGKYDLVLLDLVMPEEDGFSVLEKVHSLGHKANIIVSSNLSQEGDIERAKSLGAADYFIKSDTSLAEVVERVNNLLNGTKGRTT